MVTQPRGKRMVSSKNVFLLPCGKLERKVLRAVHLTSLTNRASAIPPEPSGGDDLGVPIHPSALPLTGD